MEKPKKILIFSLAYYPSFVSGAEAAIKEITDRISASEFEFYMLTLWFDTKAPKYEQIGNVHIHRVGFGGAYLSKVLFIPLSAITAWRMHRQQQFAGMWGMMTYMTMPITLTRWLGVKIPYFITLQDGDPYEKVFERWFIKPLLPVIDAGFKNASLIQVISDSLGEWPSRRGYKGEVVKVYNGGNPKDFDVSSVPVEKIEFIKKKYNKQPNDVWLVNTARLVHQKAFDDTVRALSQLPENVKFMIVGGGGDEEMLKALTSELRIKDRVIFVGPVDRSEVTAYRRAADIFVMPSRSEGLGNAGLSAMASRLPFVGTTEGGLAEYVFDTDSESEYGKTGWVVPKDNPAAIAKAVNTIIDDKGEVEQVTENARKMVEERYHWDAIADDMKEKVFTKILEK